MQKQVVKETQSICYYIVEDVNVDGKTYGVGIKGIKDFECIQDVFSCKEICLEFINLLCKEELEPEHLYDVVVDYLG